MAKNKYGKKRSVLMEIRRVGDDCVLVYTGPGLSSGETCQFILEPAEAKELLSALVLALCEL